MRLTTGCEIRICERAKAASQRVQTTMFSQLLDISGSAVP
jgi:hypothetical protein